MAYEVPLVGPDSGLGWRSDHQDVVTSAYIILAIEIQKFPLIRKAHRIGMRMCWITTMMTCSHCPGSIYGEQECSRKQQNNI